MRYRVEQRIVTQAALRFDEEASGSCGFTCNDVTFSPWETQKSDKGWTHNYWLARMELDKPDLDSAYQSFAERLSQLIPRIAVLTQCYTEYRDQPFLAHQHESDHAVFFLTARRRSPLPFEQEHLGGLDALLQTSDLPPMFYWYWHDAINAEGYAAKLLLMGNAVEALAKHAVKEVRDDNKKKAQLFRKITDILGVELKEILWGTQKNRGNDALRHRLSHGEYLQRIDFKSDYASRIHKQVVKYLNQHHLPPGTIAEEATAVPRHPAGTLLGAPLLIRARNGSELSLIPVLRDFELGGGQLTAYEIIPPKRPRPDPSSSSSVGRDES